MKSPTTDHTLGIHVDHSQTFADLRQKATDEYIERAKKRKKDKTITLPQHKIGDQIIVTHGYQSKSYTLIEVIDFHDDNVRYSYYGIILKTTNKDMKKRIGRLYKTDSWIFGGHIENIPQDSIRWE